MKRALGLVAVVGLVSACGPAAHPVPVNTNWRIRLDRAIGSVRYGETQDRIEAVIGPGRSVQLDHYNHKFVFYSQAALYVGFFSHAGKSYAIALITKSSRYKTPGGIGVGTAVERLRRVLPVVCDGDGYTHGKLTTSISNPRSCQFPRSALNHPFTSFTLDSRTKSVTEIAIFPGGD